jgi:hypothetical protein
MKTLGLLKLVRIRDAGKERGGGNEMKNKMKMKSLKIHPAADWLPPLNGSEFQELKADIKARGLREPILVRHGRILDGRHRYKACIELGIEPTVEEYKGDDIIAEIASRNLFRRNLTPQQRAALVVKMCGGKLSAEAQGRIKAHQFGETITVGTAPLKSAQPQTRGETAEKVAKIAKVGRDVAREALQAAPADLDAVIDGKVKLSKLATLKRSKRAQPEKWRSPFDKALAKTPFRQIVETRWVKFMEYFPATRSPEVIEIVREFVGKAR